MKTAMIAVMLFGGSSANATQFAISCKGTAVNKYMVGSLNREKSNPLPEQIYVVDEGSKVVRRALIPRQEYDTVCESKGKAPDVSIAPGLILVTGTPDFSDDYAECRLEIDRKTGKAQHFMRFSLSGDNYTEMTWDMMCKKTAIPDFDTSKNKF